MSIFTTLGFPCVFVSHHCVAREDSLRDGNFLYSVHIHIYPQYPTQSEKEIKEIVSGFVTAEQNLSILLFPHQRLKSNNLKIEDFTSAMEIFGGQQFRDVFQLTKSR